MSRYITTKQVEIVRPSVELLTPLEEIKRQLIVCAKSGGLSHRTDNRFDLTNPGAEEKKVEDFLYRIAVKKGHESILEHGNAVFLFTMSRVCSHELVRHRIAAYTQESSRYIPYKYPAFITPPYMYDWPDPGLYSVEEIKPIPETLLSAIYSFQGYKNTITNGVKREGARYLLPHCLATRIAMTSNFRNWRHVIQQRTQKAAAPEIRLLFNQVSRTFKKIAPVLVEGIKIGENP